MSRCRQCGFDPCACGKEDYTESPFRDQALQLTREAASKNYNLEYGFKAGEPNAYTPEGVDPDQFPMATDCVQFVLWLASRDSGQLGLRALSPTELEYLGDAAIEWTGE
jgi:hypothetical protein